MRKIYNVGMAMFDKSQKDEYLVINDTDEIKKFNVPESLRSANIVRTHIGDIEMTCINSLKEKEQA